MTLFRPFTFVVVLATTGWCFAQEHRDFYKHFEGTINQQYRIQMDLRLMRVPYDSDSLERFEGFYHYESKGILLNLTGQYRNGLVELEAYSAQGGEATERFIGRISETGAFSGTWRNQDHEYPFSLQEIYTNGSVSFRPVAYTSSVKLRPNHPRSPKVSSHREFLLPAGNSKPPHFLFDSLAAVARLRTRVATPQAVRNDLAAAARRYFVRTKREFAAETAANDTLFWTHREHNETLQVAYNSGGLLSVGLGVYEFTGGAHGNYGVTYSVYDLPSRRQVTYQRLFKTGIETALLPLLLEYAKRNYGLAPAQKLTDGGFFDDFLPVTDNFYLTNKTVTFCYTPYEVAPYAMGMISVTIPYERLRPLLNDTAPIRRFWAVAAR